MFTEQSVQFTKSSFPARRLGMRETLAKYAAQLKDEKR